MLLLLEGPSSHLPAPKTHFAKDIVFDRDTPIFATSKGPIVFVGKGGCFDEKETEIMSARWKLFSFFLSNSREFAKGNSFLQMVLF